MKTAKGIRKILAGLLAFTLALILGAGVPVIPAYAASGNVYTCTINPCYRHPVTGVIEDSGGEAAYATGQGMVESAVNTTGIIEVTSDGNYYLTIRMSLMDYTSNHSFWAQNVGDSGWMTPALGVTGNGTDSNGATTDICIQVPSENCVVRGAMYVEPMGRDVVFYFYPSNYVAGNSTNMNSTMITPETSADTNDTRTSGTNDTNTSTQDNSNLTSGNSSLQSSTTEEEETTDKTGTEEEETPDLQSSIVEPVTENTLDTDDITLNNAQGLSLSTAEEAEDEESSGTGFTMGQLIFAHTISNMIAGLILMAIGVGVVYYFRRNWRRLGGGANDDE